MNWHREIDYHGSRTYSAEQPQLRLLSVVLAWFATIARSKLRKLARRSTTPTMLIHDGRHGFSVLGVNRQSDTAKCQVPIKAGVGDRRDWRVLP